MPQSFCLARAAARSKSQDLVGKHPFNPPPRAWGARRAFRLAALLLPALLTLAATARCAPQIYTLDDCLGIASRQNPDVLAAAKRLDATKAAITVARGQVFPQLSSSGFYERLEQSVATNGGEYPNFQPNDYTADVRLTQNLYSAGAVRGRIAIAETQEKAEALTYQAALDTVALSVRTAFYQTLYARELIGIRRQAIDLLRAQVKDQQDRLAAGSVAQLNVNRAQVSLTNEEPQLAEANYELSAAYVLLSQLLAIPFPQSAPEVPFRLRGELKYVPMQFSLDELLQRADVTRPEITARKLAIDALRRQIVVEKSATRPQLSGFVAYDLYSEQDLRAVNGDFSGYTVGLVASWQIFDGFMTRGRVRTVQAQEGEAEAALVSTRLQVEADVRTAFYDLQQAEATLKPEGSNIRLANENLDLNAKNFDAGLNTQLDVLQSRVDLTRAELTELTGRQAYNTALARLLRAVGVKSPE